MVGTERFLFGSLRQFRSFSVPIVCANRRVTTTAPAGSDAAPHASAINDLRWLAQVMTLSDALPGASHHTTAQCGSSLCLFPTGIV